jgi:glycogen operon protein
VCFAGYQDKKNQEDPKAVFLAVNTYWEDLDATLPALPEGSGYGWVLAADTFLEKPFEAPHDQCFGSFRIGARSVRIYEAILLK